MRQASSLDAAINRYQTALLDTFLEVRIAYYRALLALEQISVQEASVRLLERELQDNQRRFDAGSVPRFNVLRADVELANAKPRLIRARNTGARISGTATNPERRSKCQAKRQNSKHESSRIL